MTPAQLVDAALDFVRDWYDTFRFFKERDIEWTLQKHIWTLIEDHDLPMRVFDQHSMPGGNRADIVITDTALTVLFIVELKYEPNKERADILGVKVPATNWQEIIQDIEKVDGYVLRREAPVAISILVDEGSEYRGKALPLHAPAEWIDWTPYVSRHPVSVLTTRFGVA